MDTKHDRRRIPSTRRRSSSARRDRGHRSFAHLTRLARSAIAKHDGSDCFDLVLGRVRKTVSCVERPCPTSSALMYISCVIATSGTASFTLVRRIAATRVADVRELGFPPVRRGGSEQSEAAVGPSRNQVCRVGHVVPDVSGSRGDVLIKRGADARMFREDPPAEQHHQR